MRGERTLWCSLSVKQLAEKLGKDVDARMMEGRRGEGMDQLDFGVLTTVANGR